MDFYDLTTWKESHKLVLQVYNLTLKFPASEKFAIADQMKRAVSSITANIAEGYGRFTYPDRIHFYHQARGSIKEIQNFLFLTKDLNYITSKDFDLCWEQSKASEMLLNGLIKSSESLK